MSPERVCSESGVARDQLASILLLTRKRHHKHNSSFLFELDGPTAWCAHLDRIERLYCFVVLGCIVMSENLKLSVVIPSSESDRCPESVSDIDDAISDTAILVSLEDIEREVLLKCTSRGCHAEPLTPKGCKPKFKRHKVPPPGLYPLNFSPYQMFPRQPNFHALPRCHAR